MYVCVRVRVCMCVGVAVCRRTRNEEPLSLPLFIDADDGFRVHKI